jgi:hypothetical protein
MGQTNPHIEQKKPIKAKKISKEHGLKQDPKPTHQAWVNAPVLGITYPALLG